MLGGYAAINDRGELGEEKAVGARGREARGASHSSFPPRYPGLGFPFPGAGAPPRPQPGFVAAEPSPPHPLICSVSPSVSLGLGAPSHRSRGLAAFLAATPPRTAGPRDPPRPAPRVAVTSCPARGGLAGGGGGGDLRAMVALENPEGGPEEAAATAGVVPGGRRTL